MNVNFSRKKKESPHAKFIWGQPLAFNWPVISLYESGIKQQPPSGVARFSKKFLKGELAGPANYIANVGTVLRVDVAVDLIVFIDGLLSDENSNEGKKRSVPLSLFYGAKKRNADGTLNTLNWVKNAEMSSFIGRVYTDSIGVQYKTMYARYDTYNNWFLVDTSFL